MVKVDIVLLLRTFDFEKFLFIMTVFRIDFCVRNFKNAAKNTTPDKRESLSGV